MLFISALTGVNWQVNIVEMNDLEPAHFGPDININTQIHDYNEFRGSLHLLLKKVQQYEGDHNRLSSHSEAISTESAATVGNVPHRDLPLTILNGNIAQ